MSDRHEQALDKAIEAAKEQKLLQDIDEGIVSAARAAARALDNAESTPKGGYITAQILAPYREILAELKLTPATRVGEEEAVDPITELMNEMAKHDDAGSQVRD